MGYLMYQRHSRVPLSYDLTTFQILGQNLSNFFVDILVQTMTPKGHFEINWPLKDPKTICGPKYSGVSNKCAFILFQEKSCPVQSYYILCVYFFFSKIQACAKMFPKNIPCSQIFADFFKHSKSITYVMP